MKSEIRLVDGIKITFDELAVTNPNGTPRIMILLRKKKLNPEDVPEELLYLTDKSGAFVLDVCIERFKEPVINNRGRTVPRALSLVNKQGCELPLYFRKVKEILRIAREDGWTVAHALARRKKLPAEMMMEEILFLTDSTGCSVAYYAAHQSSFPEWAKRNKEILLLGDGHKDRVIYVLARRGILPVEMMTEKVLSWTDSLGCSIAYYVVKNNSLPNWAKYNKNILMLGNGHGDCVVHMLARQGTLPAEMMTEEILKLENHAGCSVAYCAAKCNLFPEWAKRRRDILLLDDGHGDRVVHVLARRGHLPIETMTPDILRLENGVGQGVFHFLYKYKNLSPEILLLPWNENIRVFEYLRSEQFRKQERPNEQDIIYVQEQLTKLMELIQKQSLSELSTLEYEGKSNRSMDR